VFILSITIIPALQPVLFFAISPGGMFDVSMIVDSSRMEISGSTLETVMLLGRLTPDDNPGDRFSEETEVMRSPEPEFGSDCRPWMPKKTIIFVSFRESSKTF
jgi:hypothetical protein